MEPSTRPLSGSAGCCDRKMAFFGVFGLILLLGLLGKRPGARSYVLIAAAAGLAATWEVVKS